MILIYIVDILNETTKMITNEIIESFLNCDYKVYLKTKRETDTKHEYVLLQENMLESCKDKYYSNTINRYSSSQILQDCTLDTNKIKKEIYFIIRPKIENSNYNILLDAIEIYSDKTSKNKIRHIPVLIIHQDKFTKKDKLYLCIKSLIFSKFTGIEYEHGKIIFGQELKSLKFKLKPYEKEAKKIIEEIDKLGNNKNPPILFQKNHCKICEFRNLCKNRLIKEDSLSLLTRIGPEDIIKLNNKGIFTLKQLSYTFKPRKKSRRVQTDKHPYYHSLQALAIRENKVYVYEKINLAEAKIQIFVDMEGNADGTSIYLIGLLIKSEEKEGKYQFWANSKEEEFKIIQEFLDILESHNNAYLFYFGKYESRVFKRLLKENIPSNVKELIRKRTINILSIIHSNIYFPTYSNSLKDIGTFLGCKWFPISNAIESVVYRAKWEESNDMTYKEMLINYNQEDCLALMRVTEFLYKIMVQINSEEFTNNTKTICFVETIKPSDDDKLRFKNMEYATNEIEVITKCAYFEYQRNKIYWRSNKNIRKIVRRKLKQRNVPIRINKVILIKSHLCPFCKSKDIIANLNNKYNLTIYDLKIADFYIKKWIIRYSTFSYKCNKCERHYIPNTFKKIRFYSRRNNRARNYMKHNQEGWGHSLVSWIIHQYIVNRTTFRNMESNLKYYFKIPLGNREIWEIKLIAAKYYKQTYNDILNKLITGYLIHADESKVRLKFQSGYIWVFTSIEEVFYMYRPNRESNFLEDFLKGFNGTLVTDFYTGYDKINCKKQKCLIHLIRDLNDVLLKNLDNEEVKNIVNNFAKLLREIVGTIDKHGLKSRYLRKHKKIVNKFFNELKKINMHSEVAEKIKIRLIKDENELFTFLDYNNIPWNNNNVEYAIKTFKDYLNLMKGTITENGIHAHLILLSIYQTCNYKGINFLDFLLSKEKDIDKFEEGL